jgi:hypothetical protein
MAYRVGDHSLGPCPNSALAWEIPSRRAAIKTGKIWNDIDIGSGAGEYNRKALAEGVGPVRGSGEASRDRKAS